MRHDPSVRRSLSDPAHAKPPHRRGPYAPAMWPGGMLRAIARRLYALMR